MKAKTNQCKNVTVLFEFSTGKPRVGMWGQCRLAHVGHKVRAPSVVFCPVWAHMFTDMLFIIRKQHTGKCGYRGKDENTEYLLSCSQKYEAVV